MNQKKRSNLNDFILQFNEANLGCKSNNNSALSMRLVEGPNTKNITPDATGIYNDKAIIPSLKPNFPIEKSVSTRIDQSSDDEIPSQRLSYEMKMFSLLEKRPDHSQ